MTMFLEGHVEPTSNTINVEALHDEIRELRNQLVDARRDAAADKRQYTQSVSELRRQLTPLYRALGAVFGELDVLGEDAAEPVNSRTEKVWQSWKDKMPGYPARIISALLLHSEMNTQQLAIAVGCNKQRISEGIVKLNKAGLINKNGGRFSLKTL